MKKKLLLTTLMALLVGNALAQGGYTIKAGGTYASFRGQESERDWGLTLGLGREWKTSKRTGLTLELMYITKKAILRNKTVGSYLWGIGDGFDIYCDVRYIEIPLVWTYYWPVRKALSIKLHAGPSLELAMNDRSKKVHLYSITFPQPGFKYDYTFPQEPYPLWRGSSGFNLNGGVVIGLSSYTVELRCSRALHDIDVISGIAMNEKLDFFQLLFGLRIK